MESEPVDAAVAALAARQYGVVSWGQLQELGLGKNAIVHRVRSGRLHRIQPAIYAVGYRLVRQEGWWMAAVLASGSSTVLSHHSASALWGLRGSSERAVEVIVPRRSTSSRQVRRHCCFLPADEWTVERGIPVTTVPRTIFDLAASEPTEAVDSLVREAEYRRLWDPLSLQDLVERYPGRRGVRRVRLALERVTFEPPGRRRSRLEERFAPFLRRYGLPQPRFNDWILLDHRRFQVDCHWPGTTRIVELDGWEGHGTMSAFRDDRGRDRALSVAGYHVTRLTWRQLDDEPEEIAADLRSLLRVPRGLKSTLAPGTPQSQALYKRP